MSGKSRLNSQKQGENKILKAFGLLYPNPKSELNFSNEYELLISVLLSAQCTDKKVNQVTPKLFEKYQNFQGLSAAQISELESIVRPINYYKTKSRNLIALASIVSNQYGGTMPRSFEELIKLPGVGRKTANVILGELGLNHTLPVDTHVFRVAQRLGWAKGKTPEEIEEQLREKFKSNLWRPIHHWLILHGRRVCKAQRPLCNECKLTKLCPKKLTRRA